MERGKMDENERDFGVDIEALELARNWLEKKNAFGKHENVAMASMRGLLGDEIPIEMKTVIANYTLATFVSHFHMRIKEAEDNLIPVNMIGFVLAHSGSKKTSSTTALEKSMGDGYKYIAKARRLVARSRMTNDETVKLNPLTNALSTEAGMIQRLNDFKREGLGLPSLFVDEIATELQSSQDVVDNIKLVAQLFDEGEAKSKALKDKEKQSDEVHGMGMCALFIGSEYGVLNDELVLKKFEMEFISKLARRSYFAYPVFERIIEKATTMEELIERRHKKKEISSKLKDFLNKRSADLAKELVENERNEILLSPEARMMWETYHIYCEELGKEITNDAIMLEQSHRAWKTLKLSGVYAILNGHEMIMEQDYLEAIHAAEMLNGHMAKFQYKANRQKYEILMDMMMEGETGITPHVMIKKKLIKNVKEISGIIELANSKLGKRGEIKEYKGELVYEEFNESKDFGMSVKGVSGVKAVAERKNISLRDAKIQIAKSETIDGYKYGRMQLENIRKVLSNDTAFCPFEYIGGKRSKDTTGHKTNLLVLDIDGGGMTDQEAADIYEDYAFIIARTSDNANPYKFRLVFPLDIEINLEPTQWMEFLKIVSTTLGIDIDILPQSQFMFGYKDATIIENLDAEYLEASIMIKEIGAAKEQVQRITSRAVLNDIWQNRRKKFWYAYEARQGTGVPLLIYRAMTHAHDLGFTFEQNVELIDEIVDAMPATPREGYVEGTLALQRKQMYEKDKE